MRQSCFQSKEWLELHSRRSRWVGSFPKQEEAMVWLRFGGTLLDIGDDFLCQSRHRNLIGWSQKPCDHVTAWGCTVSLRHVTQFFPVFASCVIMWDPMAEILGVNGQFPINMTLVWCSGGRSSVELLDRPACVNTNTHSQPPVCLSHWQAWRKHCKWQRNHFFL